MEKRLFEDPFEKYLREQADAFRMYPSPSVWHGIYNHVRPGNRLPSTQITFLLIGLLFVVNYLNLHRPLISPATSVATRQAIASVPSADKLTASKIALLDYHQISKESLGNENLRLIKTTIRPTKQQSNQRYVDVDILATRSNGAATVPGSISSIEIQESKPITYTNALNVATITPIKSNRISWSYYVAPNVSYRQGESDASGIYQNVTIPQSSVGVEVGSVMSYQFTDNLQLRTGLQLNYSSYKLMSTQPVQTISSDESNYFDAPAPAYSSATETSDNTIRANNYTLQASLPIGMQYRFLNTRKISLSAGANVQPTYLIAGNFYRPGGKGAFASNAPGFRDFNLNTEFGTYINFNATRLNWEIGPQIRYQLLSSYVNTPFNEHLLNYGIRFGISRAK
jgi:hypothetical protein